MRKPVVVALLVVALLIGVVVVVRSAGGGGSGRALLGRPPAGDNQAIDTFFARYVEPDGRVVRHDEGGDTVSEGQAYAMLMAVARGDRAGFERVWGWTKKNLQRPDGLLSWKWARGRVQDPSPATDADIDIARALVRAGAKFESPALREEGLRVARGVLDHETIDAGGRLVLAAGPWAVERRVVNPSYVSPCSYSELKAATGDERWERLREGDHAVLDALTKDGLPPDWAQVDGSGAARATGPPDEQGQPGRYGPDAARVPFRVAEGCGERWDALATRLWDRLRDVAGQGAALAYRLDGTVLESQEHPVGLVGAAAAARAAGDDKASARLLRRARDLDARAPTYYGSAWVALGATLLGSGGGGEG